MERGILIAVWVTLPLTAGNAVASALDSWSTAPQVVAALLLWATWAAGLLAILVPRPLGLTVVRAAAPLLALVAVAIAVTGGADAVESAAAVVFTLVAAVLAARPAVASAAANGIAYGDEERFPLRTPPALFLGPLPGARVVLGAAIAAGPLLLADERWVAGVLALAVGVPLVVVLARALHGLSKRWAVLVPAGFVVVDPLTLSDPVLFVREHIVTLRVAGARAPDDPEVLDLRLGATLGTLSLVLDDPAEVFRAARARRGAVTVRARDARVAVSNPGDVLAAAAARRIRVEVAQSSPARAQAATPPPTSSSPS